MQPATRTAFTYAVIIALGGFVFGYDATVISGALGFIKTEFDLSSGQVALIFFATGFAAMVAAFSVGVLADKFSRKRTLQFLALLYIISALLATFARSFETLLVARAIGGYAFGSLVVAPIYIAEISPAHLRGRLGTINQLNIVIGLSMTYFVNLLLLSLSQSGAPWVSAIGMEEHVWNWMFAMLIFPAVLWFVLLMFLPQSPRWLATQLRWEECETVLVKLVQPSEVKSSMDDIRRVIADKPPPLRDRIAEAVSPRMRFVLMIGIIIGITQQISGINAIFYYAATIFELTGVGQNAAFAQAVMIGVTNVIFTILVIGLIDKVGRRPLMIIGMIGITLSMGLTTYEFHKARYEISADDTVQISEIINPQTQRPYGNAKGLTTLVGKSFDNDVAFNAAVNNVMGEGFMRDHSSQVLTLTMKVNSKLILFGIIAFVASFAMSLGPIMWVFFGEIFPVKTRGIAISIATFFNSATSMLITTFFAVQIDRFGITSTFMVFFICSLIGLVLITWLMPETKGLTLEEIEQKYVTEKARR